MRFKGKRAVIGGPLREYVRGRNPASEGKTISRLCTVSCGASPTTSDG
jgi:hypothetical protein